jgi:hypothetical protein
MAMLPQVTVAGAKVRKFRVSEQEIVHFFIRAREIYPISEQNTKQKEFF